MDRDDVLRVANLTVMHCLEVLLELVKFSAQILTLCLDAREAFLGISESCNCKFALEFIEFGTILTFK